MGVFFKGSRAANSTVHDRILPNFELVQDIMVVLHTCNNEEHLIKNEDARVLTRLYVVFSIRSREANSNVSDGILPKFELIQAFIAVLVTRICENKDADQLRCFRYIDSTIPLLSKFIRNFKPLAILCGCTAQFVWDLVGNPEDWFSHNEAHFCCRCPIESMQV